MLLNCKIGRYTNVDFTEVRTCLLQDDWPEETNVTVDLKIQNGRFLVEGWNNITGENRFN